MFHLVGDVHQPLHSATLITSDFPQGDRGGTRFFIRARENTRTISLHKFWDDTIIGSERFRSVNNRAMGLRQRPEFRRSGIGELSETRFAKSADTESFNAAKQQAYRNGNLRGSADSNDGVVLPQDYAATRRSRSGASCSPVTGWPICSADCSERLAGTATLPRSDALHHL